MSKTISENKEGFIARNKTFFIAFPLFLVYFLFFIIENGYREINSVAYEFLSATYSAFGFVSKVLPGAIYNLLIGSENKTVASIYGMGMAVLMIFLVCVIMQKFMNVVKDNKTKTKVLFLLLMSTGPCTFAWFLGFYACMDMHWMILFLIAYILSESRYLRWITPVFFAGMLFIHNGAVLCAAPLLGLIFLLRAASADNKYDKVSFSILFALAVVFTAVPFVYFSLYDTANIKFSSLEEMDKWLEAKGVTGTEFYDWSFFPKEYAEQQKDIVDFTLPDWLLKENGTSFVNFGITIVRQVYFNIITTNFESYLSAFVFTIPVFAINYIVLGSYIKKTDNKLKKFVGFCFITLSVLNILSFVFFSNDILRWLAHALFISFGGIMAIAKFDDKSIFEKYEQILDKFNLFEIIVYMSVYVVGLV